MTVIDEFVALLGVKTDASSFAKADQRLNSLGQSVKNIATGFGALFAGQQIVSGFKALVDEADHLGDASARLGITTEALQALGYAADQNASSLEEVQVGLQFLQKNSQAAVAGSKEMTKAFKTIGVSSKELKNGLPTEELLARLADTIADTENPAKKTALAMQILGKSGAALIPLLNNGRDGLEEFFKEFEESGGGFTKDFIEKSQEVNDQLGKMRFQWLGLASQLGSVLLPVLNKVLGQFSTWARSLSDVLKGSEFLRSAIIVGTAALVAWAAASLFASEALRSKLGLIAALALAAAALDEIAVALKGGKTLIGEWIDSWAGLGTVDSLVRSIGQGLQQINQLGYFGAIKQAVTDVRDISADRSRREDRIEKLKTDLANEKDPEKKQVIVRELIKQLNLARDIASAQLGETPRTSTRGLGAGLEVVEKGTASASAVNEGAFNTLFGGTGVATTNDKGQTVYQTINNKTDVKVEAKTGADAREIGRIVRDHVDESNRSVARQLKYGSARKKPTGSNPGVGGDSAVDGVDD